MSGINASFWALGLATKSSGVINGLGSKSVFSFVFSCLNLYRVGLIDNVCLIFHSFDLVVGNMSFGLVSGLHIYVPDNSQVQSDASHQVSFKRIYKNK